MSSTLAAAAGAGTGRSLNEVLRGARSHTGVSSSCREGPPRSASPERGSPAAAPLAAATLARAYCPAHGSPSRCGVEGTAPTRHAARPARPTVGFDPIERAPHGTLGHGWRAISQCAGGRGTREDGGGGTRVGASRDLPHGGAHRLDSKSHSKSRLEKKDADFASRWEMFNRERFRDCRSRFRRARSVIDAGLPTEASFAASGSPGATVESGRRMTTYASVRRLVAGEEEARQPAVRAVQGGVVDERARPVESARAVQREGEEREMGEGAHAEVGFEKARCIVTQNPEKAPIVVGVGDGGPQPVASRGGGPAMSQLNRPDKPEGSLLKASSPSLRVARRSVGVVARILTNGDVLTAKRGDARENTMDNKSLSGRGLHRGRGKEDPRGVERAGGSAFAAERQAAHEEGAHGEGQQERFFSMEYHSMDRCSRNAWIGSTANFASPVLTLKKLTRPSSRASAVFRCRCTTGSRRRRMATQHKPR